ETIMRRTWLLTALGLTLGAAGAGFFALPNRSPARPAEKGDEGKAEAAVPLPIAQVVLFSSGVGYFQREGTVEGQARGDLSFPVRDVNGLVRSMVRRDLDGGHVAAVSYDSSAPLERPLSSFAVNLTGNPPLFELLNQARGERLEVALANTPAGSAATLSGTLVGLEKQKQPSGKDQTIEGSVRNLWCADGLRSVKLTEVQRVRFLNPALEGELKKALEALALSHDAQKKAVSV